MASYEEPPGGSGESSSARRARLRGSLAKALPPDPYASSSSANASPPSIADPDEVQAEVQNEAAQAAHSMPASLPDLPDPPDPPDPPEPSLEMQADLPAPSAKTQELQRPNGAPPVERRQSHRELKKERNAAAQNEQDQLNQVTNEDSAASANEEASNTVPSIPDPPVSPQTGSGSGYGANSGSVISVDPSAFALAQSQALEALTSIDQAMNACAMNLSNMQKMASEQTDSIKSLAETLQTQTFSELGLSLNGLVESLSAALEPMKAVGELVPAIDSLVSAMEGKEEDKEPKLNAEQLVMNLADQLSTGMIDPWTFKCAYIAVFPTDHPADLLHRLVDLLGTQRLSGELFRAAYDAVQAAEPPPLPQSLRRRRATPEEQEGSEQKVEIVQDEALLAEIESLRRAQEELALKDKQREEELAALVASKDNELKAAHDQLNDRWQEFSTKHEELANLVQKRDEMLQERESELANRSRELQQKDSENQVLKLQLEELRENTQEMVKDLQKQLNETKAKQDEIKNAPPAPVAPAPAKPQSSPGFFDVATGADPTQNPSLFDNGPARPLFQQQMQGFNQAGIQKGPEPAKEGGTAPGIPQQPPQPQQMQQQIPQSQQQITQPQPQQIPQPQQQAGPATVPQPSNQAIPNPPQQNAIAQQAMPKPPTPQNFVPGSGSYGIGVRAQVFEVIVRQALAGAPWREICAGPMQVNNITPDEVESEVKRRQALLKK